MFLASYDWYHLLKCANGWHNNIETEEMKNTPYAEFFQYFTKLV